MGFRWSLAKLSQLSHQFPRALGRGRGLRPPSPDCGSKVAGGEAHRHPAPRGPESRDPSSERAGRCVTRHLPPRPARPGPWRRERHQPPTVSAARPAQVLEVRQVGGSAGSAARPPFKLRPAAALRRPLRSLSAAAGRAVVVGLRGARPTLRGAEARGPRPRPCTPRPHFPPLHAWPSRSQAARLS